MEQNLIREFQDNIKMNEQNRLCYDFDKNVFVVVNNWSYLLGTSKPPPRITLIKHV